MLKKKSKVAQNFKSWRKSRKLLKISKVAKQLVATPSKGHTYTNPRPGQYLTQAHSQITRAVAAMDSCFALIWVHQHSIDIHGCHRRGDMAVRMREILARRWVGVSVPVSLRLSISLPSFCTMIRLLSRL